MEPFLANQAIKKPPKQTQSDSKVAEFQETVSSGDNPDFIKQDAATLELSSGIQNKSLGRKGKYKWHHVQKLQCSSSKSEYLCQYSFKHVSTN